jgi:phosphoadenosine phosphosulfate reductase
VNILANSSQLNIVDATAFDELVKGTASALVRIATELAPAVFASSLAAEDMVLTDLILKEKLSIGLFTLETGRLHAETLGMMDTIRQRYDYDVKPYRPDPVAVKEYVAKNGLNGFYDSVDLRKECCRIRKVEPLKAALKGTKAWITGQRRSQSATRSALNFEERDEVHGMTKCNPLADWSEADVWHYIRVNQVPYNPLHDKGYPSIGCEPCTRAIQPGEDVRAGRWWWENADSKECGLHLVDGKLVRMQSGPTEDPLQATTAAQT